MGVWNDDPEFTSPDEYATLDVDEAGGQELVDYWSWEYHLRVRPHENSDYLVERVE